MARTAETLYDFGRDIFNGLGFGNMKALATFGVTATISLLAIVGFYFPPFGIAMNWMLPLAIGGSAFAGISLLFELNPTGMFFGLVLGTILGGISFALCSSLIYIAPALSALLLVPNVISAISYGLGGIVSCLDSVCTGITNCFSAIGRCLCCCCPYFRNSKTYDDVDHFRPAGLTGRGSTGIIYGSSISGGGGGGPGSSATSSMPPAVVYGNFAPPPVFGYAATQTLIPPPQQQYQHQHQHQDHHHAHATHYQQYGYSQ